MSLDSFVEKNIINRIISKATYYGMYKDRIRSPTLKHVYLDLSRNGHENFFYDCLSKIIDRLEANSVQYIVECLDMDIPEMFTVFSTIVQDTKTTNVYWSFLEAYILHVNGIPAVK
jgi:hypothetical protein